MFSLWNWLNLDQQNVFLRQFSIYFSFKHNLFPFLFLTALSLLGSQGGCLSQLHMGDDTPE